MKIITIPMINGKDTITSFIEKVNQKLKELGRAVSSVQWVSTMDGDVNVNFVVIVVFGE